MRSLPNSVKISLIGGMTALLAGTGVVIAWAQSNDGGDSALTSQLTSYTQQEPMGDAPQEISQGKDSPGSNFSALAQKLGVTEDQLTEAFDTIRPDAADRGQKMGGERHNPSDQDGADKHNADHDQLDQKLAEALGIDVSKVREAMAELGGPEQDKGKFDHNKMVGQPNADSADRPSSPRRDGDGDQDGSDKQDEDDT